MQVETYEVTEETTEGRPKAEVDAVSLQLIEDLGLDGQRQLLVGSDDEDVGTQLIPYRRMTEQEVVVYQECFKDRGAVEAYSAGPIPVRILQVIAHAKTLFEDIEVWGPRVHDPDPLLVGRRTPERGYGTEYYLLARWGEALVPFEDLLARARRQITERWTRKAREVIANCQRFLDDPSDRVNERLEGRSVYEEYTC